MTIIQDLKAELIEVRKSEFKIYAKIAQEMLIISKQQGQNQIMLKVRCLDEIDKQMVDELVVDFKAKNFIVNIIKEKGNPYLTLNIKEK